MTTPKTPAAPAHHDPEKMTHRQILQVLTGLLAALFTAMLSSTIVATALPTIIGDLKGTQTDYAWVVTAALLANAVSTPIWGKLADLFNKKVLEQLGIVIFVAGSVLAGFANDMTVMLVARVIQGLGMGGLTALGMAIIGSIIPPRERGRYSGYMGAVMAVATAGGPLLGGFIVDSPLGWRWTFFSCVPLAVIAMILLQFTLRIKHEKKPASIDWLGSILLSGGVSLLLIWVSFADQDGYYGWVSWESAAMVGGSIVLLALLVLVESKVKAPIIPLNIIRQRTTALVIIASVAVGIAMFASTTYLGQYFQVARGYSPTAAGLLMLPLIAGNLLGSVGSGQLITRYGKWKIYLIIGAALVVLGTGLSGMINHETDMVLVGVFLFVLGLGMGLLMQNLVLAVQNTVSISDIGAASASVAFFRTVGGAVGVSVLGAVLSRQVTSRVTTRFEELGLPTGQGAEAATLDIGSLPGPIAEIFRAAYGDGIAVVFRIAALVAVIALVSVLFIREQKLRLTLDLKPSAPVDPEVTGGSELVRTAADPAAQPAGVPAGAAQPDAGTAPSGHARHAAREAGTADDGAASEPSEAGRR
ncbi:Multidrug resistance protein 3 [Arthrobacter saudimassiliensis]|uniref:Multidrug resistance protein 3 n=1 Tax=Arthrobacter saudimassiliensis TaxID=1461584 RepID=A0A078MWG4_9MICC|nr:Multidrug resistance protein 3 [Arthrobacter saudimassiliensis]